VDRAAGGRLPDDGRGLPGRRRAGPGRGTARPGAVRRASRRGALGRALVGPGQRHDPALRRRGGPQPAGQGARPARPAPDPHRPDQPVRQRLGGTRPPRPDRRGPDADPDARHAQRAPGAGQRPRRGDQPRRLADIRLHGAARSRDRGRAGRRHAHPGADPDGRRGVLGGQARVRPPVVSRLGPVRRGVRHRGGAGLAARCPREEAVAGAGGVLPDRDCGRGAAPGRGRDIRCGADRTGRWTGGRQTTRHGAGRERTRAGGPDRRGNLRSYPRIPRRRRAGLDHAACPDVGRPPSTGRRSGRP